VKQLRQSKRLQLRLRLEVPSLWWPHLQGLWPWFLVLAAVRQAIVLATWE
jgi:hypothetical protein